MSTPRFEQLFRDNRGVLFVSEPRSDKNKLVAPETCDRVALALSRFQSLGYLNQQLVAGGMAQGVVDRLETVEIE